MASKYSLPELPYKYDALEPHISKEIMTLHHDKHHLAYVNGANTALDKLEAGRKSNWQGVDIKGIERDLSFNLAGHVLHSVFWPNMKQDGGGKPGGKLADMISSDFGSFDNFKAQFSAAAKAVEGSGWGLLVYDPTSDQLLTMQAQNHNLLASQNSVPLLVCDVWEHAYYLQYKNDRGKYVDAFWNVVNWENVDRQLGKAKK